MNDRLVVMDFVLVDPTQTNAVGALFQYFTAPPVGLTIVYVTAAPMVDDAGGTIDIDDDGTNVISGIDVSDQNVPGTWISTHFGGSNAPVVVAGNSVMAVDGNSLAAGTAVLVQVWALVGEA